MPTVEAKKNRSITTKKNTGIETGDGTKDAMRGRVANASSPGELLSSWHPGKTCPEDS